jgi:hypothetical protein
MKKKAINKIIIFSSLTLILLIVILGIYFLYFREKIPINNNTNQNLPNYEVSKASDLGIRQIANSLENKTNANNETVKKMRLIQDIKGVLLAECSRSITSCPPSVRPPIEYLGSNQIIIWSFTETESGSFSPYYVTYSIIKSYDRYYFIKIFDTVGGGYSNIYIIENLSSDIE